MFVRIYLYIWFVVCFNIYECVSRLLAGECKLELGYVYMEHVGLDIISQKRLFNTAKTEPSQV